MSDINFHINAKKLIPDERLWDIANMFAPHGNDTGNDILSIVNKNRDNPTVNPMTPELGRPFYTEITESWGTKAGIGPDDSIEYNLHREIVVGLAFAHVKIFGFCSPWLQNLALKEINNYYQYLDGNELNWGYRDECREHLVAMKQCMKAVPNTSENIASSGKPKSWLSKLLGKS